MSGTTSEQQYRIERDSMGEMQVPIHALYGASTARAVENFPISSLRLPRSFIRALGLDQIRRRAGQSGSRAARSPRKRSSSSGQRRR